MGYCMGVKRAMEKALCALEEYPEKQVYSFGPLIHNEIAMSFLAEKGLKILTAEDLACDKNDSFDAKNSVVIIRAHGVAPETKRRLSELGSFVIDATCPKVLSSQKKASDFVRRGFDLIIAGDKRHGEVVGIQGVAQEENCQQENTGVEVVENEKQADELLLNNPNTAILCQTTFSPLEYEKIVDSLKKKNPALTVLNTICSATEERQNSLHELCRECDVVVVIGGKESANTRRLFELAEHHCSQENFRIKKAFHFADLTEIQEVWNDIKEFFSCPDKSDFTVGITAGASTPESCIAQIEGFLSDLDCDCCK